MTDELPPPSGPPQAGPVPPAPPMSSTQTSPDMSTGEQPGGVIVPMPPAPLVPPARTPTPGPNGLAIAALCCGLVGIIPVAAIVGLVLGVVALNQLQRRVQRGRGMAIAGIVLGALWLIGWVAFVIDVANDEPARNPSGAVTQKSEAFVDDLKAGDCFSGGQKDEIDLVTVIPCASPHESQVVLTFELPDGPYPGEDAVIKASEQGCTDRADPLLTSKAYDELEPSSIYPADSFVWRGDRTILCVVDARSGTTTGTALK